MGLIIIMSVLVNDNLMFESCLFCLPLSRKCGMANNIQHLDLTNFSRKKINQALNLLREGAMIEELIISRRFS